MLQRLGTVVILCAAAGWSLASSPYEIKKPPLPVVKAATEVEVKQLTDAWNKAVAEKDDAVLQQALVEMEQKKHDSFVAFIRVGMKSKEPKVVGAALRAAASHGVKEFEKEARKLLRAKGSGKEQVVSGASTAGAIDYLVRLDFPPEKGEDVFILEELLEPMYRDERRLKASWATDMVRATMHWFGRHKSKKAVRQLITMVDEPFPENVNSGSNPPASYWKPRWELWQKTGAWARWALKEITGKELRLMREWQKWLQENEKEYAEK